MVFSGMLFTLLVLIKKVKSRLLLDVKLVIYNFIFMRIRLAAKNRFIPTSQKLKDKCAGKNSFEIKSAIGL